MIGHFLSPLGWIEYDVIKEKVVKLSFVEEPSEKSIIKDSVFHALNDYFSGKGMKFDIDVDFQKGTEFQQQVWKELLKIPYGETKSYQDISIQINKPKALRAVGQACKRNPIGIIVPCHRVIGKDHSMRGYSGKDHINLKIALLEHEKSHIKPR